MINNNNIATLSEAQLANLLTNFSSSFVFDIIEDQINNKYATLNSTNSIANMIRSYEQQFVQLSSQYPWAIHEISECKEQTYTEIVNFICAKFNMSQLEGFQIDIYSKAYLIYDFFISGIRNNIVNFFASFIIKERNTIYETLSLGDNKKSKDSSTIYNKKVYKNNKIAIIVSQIYTVVNYILGMDITFGMFLKHALDKSRMTSIQSMIIPNGDFWMTIKGILADEQLKSLVVMDIILAIQASAASLDEIEIVR